MGSFFSEHIGDIIVGGVLLVIVAAIVIKMIRGKKAGLWLWVRLQRMCKLKYLPYGC